jgi:hypothetical protein
MERKKWTVNDLPVGYPRCKRRDLNNAIEDLTDTLINKSIKENKDATNQVWVKRSLTFIQVGHSELQGKNNTYLLITSFISLFIALIAIFLNAFSQR